MMLILGVSIQNLQTLTVVKMRVTVSEHVCLFVCLCLIVLGLNKCHSVIALKKCKRIKR